ncbi:MAG: alkane 1-monooxygenase [Gilvibacter sp.]
MSSDLKYLASYSIPVTVCIGLFLRGPWAYLTPLFAFAFVPFLEIVMPLDTNNLSKDQLQSKAANRFFNILLYINLPIVYGLIGYFLWSLSSANNTTSELIGLTFSVGIALGSNGINVAHELGHRTLAWERLLGKILLAPALYMHFYIEHNYGHHLHAATKEDPASAKYKQSLYSFWVTSITRQYASAWKIQNRLRKQEGYGLLNAKNDMFWYVVFQLGYLATVYVLFGPQGLLIAAIVALVSILLLEAINYIEHYGLSRGKTKSGRYERVSEIHSWNSNHVLGRVMLYELTRHSDHHYRASKKYQLLDCHESSPQMPFGYPTSMVLSLVPPLWFSIMNKRIPLEMRS